MGATAEYFASGGDGCNADGVCVERCLLCGEWIDYCLGHGEDAHSVWDAHDDGDHSMCNSLACDGED